MSIYKTWIPSPSSSDDENTLMHNVLMLNPYDCMPQSQSSETPAASFALPKSKRKYNKKTAKAVVSTEETGENKKRKVNINWSSDLERDLVYQNRYNSC